MKIPIQMEQKECEVCCSYSPCAVVVNLFMLFICLFTSKSAGLIWSEKGFFWWMWWPAWHLRHNVCFGENFIDLILHRGCKDC